MKKICLVLDCNRNTIAKGLCKLHYQRLTRTGNVELVVRIKVKKPRKPKAPCKYPDCVNVNNTGGYCNRHYQIVVLGDLPKERRTKLSKAPKSPKLPCTVNNCENLERSRGFCNKHYVRMRKHGDPLINYRRKHRKNNLIIGNVVKPETTYYTSPDEAELINELYRDNISLHEKESIY